MSSFHVWPCNCELDCDSRLELFDVGVLAVAIDVARWVRAASAGLRSRLLGRFWDCGGRVLLLSLLLAGALGLASDEVLELRNNFGSHLGRCLCVCAMKT